MTIGEYLYQYRVRNDLSMEELGAKIGVSRAYISMLENGNKARGGAVPVPSIHTLTKIAKATDVDVFALMDMTTPGTNEIVEFVADETDPTPLQALYDKASAEDKKIVDLILEKYR